MLYSRDVGMFEYTRIHQHSPLYKQTQRKKNMINKEFPTEESQMDEKHLKKNAQHA
jgi:UDP-galactopyranose mutase